MSEGVPHAPIRLKHAEFTEETLTATGFTKQAYLDPWNQDSDF